MERFLQAEKASIHINLIFSSVFGNRNYISNTMTADTKSLNNEIDIYHLQNPPYTLGCRFSVARPAGFCVTLGS